MRAPRTKPKGKPRGKPDAKRLPPRAAATGPGWGGPAKGAGKGSPTHAEFSTDIQPATASPNEDRKALKLRRSLEMEDIIHKIASDEAQFGTVRLQAAAKLHEMYNGKPIERIITDEQPIERDVIDPNQLSPEAREELRAVLEATQDKAVH